MLELPFCCYDESVEIDEGTKLPLPQCSRGGLPCDDDGA